MAPKLNEDVIDQIKDFPKYRYQSTEQKSLIDKLIPNELRERYIKYGLCKECNQPNTGVSWCQPCNSIHFRQDFSKWTSGNEKIDEFIRKFQLIATCYQEVLEWVPYENFKNIEHLAERDFSTVYKAEWIDGYILNWNANQNKWGKLGNIDIALKCLKNSQNLATGFLQEITFHKKFSINAPIVSCFGISQDPITKYFMIVMQYIPNGSLSQFLRSNHNTLSLDDKLYLFHNIVDGLKEIHNQGCIHKDLHSNNILIFNKFTCLISDFRSCKPINEERKDDEKKFLGVMPYVAPEVLRDNIYTQAADIYSFGIVACEILLELPPYHDLSHDDELLEIKIRQGLRPKLDNVNVPPLLEECLNADPSSRPTADELSNTFKVVHEFYKQGKEFNKSMSSKSNTSLNTHTIHSHKNGISEAASIAIETIVIPFSQFFSLIKNVGEMLIKIMDLYNMCQHNRKLTRLLADRIAAANTAVSVLRDDDLHTPQHYANLQRLVQVLQNMRKFSEDITQYSKLHKFLESKSIESKYNDLCKEYDSSVNLLNLALMVDFKVNVERDRKILKEEIREITKFQAALVESMNDMNKKFDQMDKVMNHVTQMSITMQIIENLGISEQEAQKKIDNVFNETPLPIDDYEKTETIRGENDKLRKYVHIKTLEEYAFKLVEDKQINQVKNQVTILKKLEHCQNIIHFYGITKDSGDVYHLVTEWAENGNLSEYIKEHGQNIKIELRLRFAYDIAKGLNFLNAAKIVHRDIKSENIVVTRYDIVKITNFKLSRGFEGATGQLAVTKESVRHNAPEMLRKRLTGTGIGTDKGKKKLYDTKSEVYSFGILLWEIAECKVAYSQFEDFMEISNKVIKGYREQFTKGTDIPEKYQNLVNETVDQNPGNRPLFAKILLDLKDIFKNYTPSGQPTSRSDSNRPQLPTRRDSLLVFSWDVTMNMNMTIDKAVEEHHNKSSTTDKKELYKYFDAYAKMGNPQAKYWKAHYITKGWSDLPHSSKKENLKIAAELYKEAADYGDEFPEAQLRYALMITQQKGPTEEAIEYLVKAAKNGHVVAMYNVATYYFSNKDEELGKRYMLMAANKKYPDAIKYCNDKNIPL